MAQSHIKLSGVAGNGKSLRATVTQSSHGFGAGDVIRYNRSAGTGSGTDQYVKAKADTAENSEVVGVVEAVAGDTFVLVYGGEIDTSDFGLDNDDVFFLSDSTEGLLSKTAPSEAGSVIKPVLIRTDGDIGVVTNYIGTIIGGTSTVTLNGIQPVGTIEPYAGTSADVPETWSLCDGGGLSVSTYDTLYNRLGNRYGYHLKIVDEGISGGNIQVGCRVKQDDNISGVVTAVDLASNFIEVDVDYLSENTDGTFTQHNRTFDVGPGQTIIINPESGDDPASNTIGSVTPIDPPAGDRADIKVTLSSSTTSIVKFRKPDLRGKVVLGVAGDNQLSAIAIPGTRRFEIGQFGGQYDNEVGFDGTGTVQAQSGSAALDNLPPYQALNWIIKTDANAKAALTDNLDVQLPLSDLTDVNAPAASAQSGDVLVFDATSNNGAKYHPYRLFTDFPDSTNAFQIDNSTATNTKIAFGKVPTQAFEIDLSGLQTTGTPKFKITSGGKNLIQATTDSSNNPTAGIGIAAQDDCNLTIGNKGLKFNVSGTKVNDIRTTVRSIVNASDTFLVTEQGIREAIDDIQSTLESALEFGVVPLEGGNITMPWGGTVRFDVASLNSTTARFTVTNNSSIKINVTGCGQTEKQQTYERSDAYGVSIGPVDINAGASKTFDASLSVSQPSGASAVQSSGLLIVKRG